MTTMKMKQGKSQKKSSYTHKISYCTSQGSSGRIQSSFRTSQDMLQWHLNEMKRGALCFDIKVELIQ